jgi:PiT family inorganic phosphate transporter
MIELVALAALLASFYVAWNIGSNNTGNAMGTAVGANILSYRRAIALMIIFVPLGAALEGYKVMKPVGTQIVTGATAGTNPFSALPIVAAVAMVIAGLWVTLQTRRGFPVSAHQAIIGALVGGGLAIGLFSNDVAAHVKWFKLIEIAVAWAITPFTAALLAYLIYRISEIPIGRVKAPERLNLIFGLSVIISGCYVAYTMGANDVGTAMGAAYAVSSGPNGLNIANIVGNLALLGAVGVAIGALIYSRKCMETVGVGIIQLDPVSAFAAQFAAALTVHLFTQFGLPVSSSFSIIGGITGVGLIGGVPAVSRNKLGDIAKAWISTPIVSMIFAFILASVILVL